MNPSTKSLLQSHVKQLAVALGDNERITSTDARERIWDNLTSIAFIIDKIPENNKYDMNHFNKFK